MGAVLLDGKGLGREIEDDLKNRVEKLNIEGIEPHLAVILVGDDPASHVYVRNKENACKRTGIKSTKIILPSSTSEKEVLDLIGEMNEDDNIHGILVQSPTPKQIDELQITKKIDPAKDVDGFHPQNLGKLVQGDTDGLLPCTPAGIMKLLEHAKIDLEGKKVTVIGRSRIVGMPLSLMLAQKGVDATVTITHSRSKNIEQICQSSDVIIAAVGEGIRLKLGFTVFGQREYESKQVSALAWGALAIGLVLLITPTREYAYPLIFSLTFGDPFMGELRRKGIDSKNVILAACVFVLGIWLACWYAFGTPIIVCLIVAPIAVLAETPRLRYIDDNATMLLIPLAAVVTLEPFLNVM